MCKKQYKIEGNSIIYPTYLYERYNLYLIKKLMELDYKSNINILQEKYGDNDRRFTKKSVKNGIETIINDLHNLLHLKTNCKLRYLDVMDWEEQLNNKYKGISIIFVDGSLKNIEQYNRIIKLENLNDNAT